MRRALPSLVLSLLLVLPVGLATAATSPRLERALTVQQRLVAERPTDSAVWNDLGNLLVIESRWLEAEDAYVRALELDPDNAEARFNLGLLLQQSGRQSAAVEQFTAVLAVAPSHAWSHYQLGAIAEARGQRNRAIEHYARAFALDASLSFAQNNPHVIDNRLMTEALLSAERYSSYPEVVPPRSFEEGGRIVELLLSSEQLAEHRGASDPGSASGAAYGTPGGSSSAAAGGVPAAGRTNDGWDPRAGDTDPTPATSASGAVAVGVPTNQGERTTTAGDAAGRDSIPGEARTVGGTAPGGTARSLPPPGVIDTPPGTTIVVPPVTTGTPQPAPRGRFQPGSNSTGRLELRLLPPDPAASEDRLAALPGSRG